MLNLVSRATQKDTLAFTELVLLYQALVISLLRGIIDQPEDVEDIYQETWVHAWRSIGTLRDAKQFKPWLCRITLNRARDWYRQKKHQDLLFLPGAGTEEYDMGFGVRLSVAGPEQQIINKACMLEAFSHLSPQMRVCILLADQWGYCLEEIAAILHISKGTVSSYLSRGRQRFCQVYQYLAGGPSVQHKRKAKTISDDGEPTRTLH